MSNIRYGNYLKSADLFAENSAMMPSYVVWSYSTQ